MMNAFSNDMARTFIPHKDDTRTLRDAFGRFATSVTVVTCDSPDGPVCITANSFSSLSLDPPLVMWAGDRNSRRFPYFHKARHFSVHVLSADQAELCFGCSKDALPCATLTTTAAKTARRCCADAWRGSNVNNMRITMPAITLSWWARSCGPAWRTETR